MARKKVMDLDPFTGDVTVGMLILWALASIPDQFELRTDLSTMQFYEGSGIEDGLRVEGTKSLAVTKSMAEDYYG